VARNTPKVKNNSFLFFFLCVEPQIDGSNKHLEVFGCIWRDKLAAEMHCIQRKILFLNYFYIFSILFFHRFLFSTLCQILLIIEIEKGGVGVLTPIPLRLSLGWPGSMVSVHPKGDVRPS
jgi:hypothetical protein